MPVNMFPTDSAHGSEVSVEWLYDNIANMSWAGNLEEAERQMFRQNGFYSTLVQPGLRLVSLNTNFCQGENFYLFMGFNDPANMLSWLTQQLLAAEQAGDHFNHALSARCAPSNLVRNRNKASRASQLYIVVCYMFQVREFMFLVIIL